MNACATHQPAVALDAANRAGEHYGRQRYFRHRNVFRDTLGNFLQAFGHQAEEEFFQAFHLQQPQDMLENLSIPAECDDSLRALRDRG